MPSGCAGRFGGCGGTEKRKRSGVQFPSSVSEALPRVPAKYQFPLVGCLGPKPVRPDLTISRGFSLLLHLNPDFVNPATEFTGHIGIVENNLVTGETKLSTSKLIKLGFAVGGGLDASFDINKFNELTRACNEP